MTGKTGKRMVLALVFFFSSRRRHTRSKRDWSSDVCSSDLVTVEHLRHQDRLMIDDLVGGPGVVALADVPVAERCPRQHVHRPGAGAVSLAAPRSEERRVGKECRGRRARDAWKTSPTGSAPH